MRKISKIKLNEFNKNELDQRKLNALKGGKRCECIMHRCPCACSGWGNEVEDNGIPSRDDSMPDDIIY